MTTIGTSSQSASEWWARYCPDSRSWRTCQVSLLDVGTDGQHMSETFLDSWPRSGTTRGGYAYRLKTQGLPTVETDGGVWHIPTPTRADVYSGKMQSTQQKPGSMHSVNLSDYVFAGSGGGDINAEWEEWLMGLPHGYTALEPMDAEDHKRWEALTVSGDWWAEERYLPQGIPKGDPLPSNNRERLMMMGNGVVPAAVALAFRTLAEAEC